MKQILLLLLVNLPLLVYSQFQETFGSHELPALWTGDRQQFVIDNGVLMVNGQEKTETVSLSYPYSIEGDEQEWEFYLYLKSKPTAKNRIKIFPASPAKTPAGFYICAGYDRSNRLRFGIDNQEIQAFNDFDEEEKCILHLIITCKDQKYWTIYAGNALSDETTKQSASFEYSYTFPEQAHFCIQVTHTKTKTDDFGIDDISYRTKITEQTEEPEQTEQSSVELTAIQPISLSEVSFEFSGPVSLEGAIYAISGYGFDGKCAAIRSMYQDSNHQIVTVRLPQAMTLDHEYTFYIENLKDEQGGIIPDNSYTFLLREAEETPETPEEQPEAPIESYSEKAVRINEVMADPKGLTALPETEYIELYNTCDSSIDLSSWELHYGNNSVALTGIKIPAHEWIVLYRSGREIEAGNGQACPLDKFPSALANTGKELSLYDGSGKQIDQYTYPKAKPACSWEYSEEGWHLSTDPRGGTPGEANSEPTTTEEEPEEEPDEPEEETNPEPEIPEALQPQPGDIIFNDLLPEPFVDGSEYLELYNRSKQELSLKDVCISTRKTDGSLNTRYPLEAYPQTLQAGDYLLLTKSIEGVENFYSLPASLNWLECKLPVLSNTGSTIVLYREDGEIIIDEVSYSPKWHAPTVKNKKGVALERKDPDKDSQNADNWTSAASSAGFGTPGLENSQYLSEETETDSEEIDDPIYQPTGTFQIPYRLNQSGYMARGWIFDLSGRKVALVADNTLLGTQGYLEWNGKGRDGSPLNTGIYIIYLELWHPGGNVIRKKQVLLNP